jgi:hypothetical protein
MAMEMEYWQKIWHLLEDIWKKNDEIDKNLVRIFSYIPLEEILQQVAPIGSDAEILPGFVLFAAYHLTLKHKLYGIFFAIENIATLGKTEMPLPYNQKVSNSVIDKDLFSKLESYIFWFFTSCTAVADILAQEINLLYCKPFEKYEKDISFSNKFFFNKKVHREISNSKIQDAIQKILKNNLWEEIKTLRNCSNHRVLIRMDHNNSYLYQDPQTGETKLKKDTISIQPILKSSIFEHFRGKSVRTDLEDGYSTPVIKLEPEKYSQFIYEKAEEILKFIFEDMNNQDWDWAPINKKAREI